MAKETVRYPDEITDTVKDQVVGKHFESKSEFYRFAAAYTLDELDIDLEDNPSINGVSYLEKRRELEEELENFPEIPDELDRETRAINKIYSGHLLDDPGLLHEGVTELVSQVDDSLVSVAEGAYEQIID